MDSQEETVGQYDINHLLSNLLASGGGGDRGVGGCERDDTEEVDEILCFYSGT